jgi:hypothetical protein
VLQERSDPKPEEQKSGKTFVVVSGFPRSGTSLMMQMLRGGGMPISSDELRAADPDNPTGYLEWEAVKRIEKEPELLDDERVRDHAFKCISMLLPKLPTKHNYKLIFHDPAN